MAASAEFGVKHMKKIILSILMMAFFASYSYAKGDTFPFDVKKSISPDGHHEIFCVEIQTPTDEIDEMQWYELRLKDISSGTEKPIKKYVRSLDVLWSPDSQHFAVTFWIGSNVSFVEIYPITGDIKEVNPYEIIRKKLGDIEEVKNDSQSYFEAIKWLDGKNLIINLFGHTNKRDSSDFSYYFEIAISGDARRLEPKEIKEFNN
jgi:hypothetical protein